MSEPDQVLVTMAEIEGGETYEIEVAEADLAVVIGRKGDTVRAVRTIVSAVATKLNRRIAVKFLQAKAEH